MDQDTCLKQSVGGARDLEVSHENFNCSYVQIILLKLQPWLATSEDMRIMQVESLDFIRAKDIDHQLVVFAPSPSLLTAVGRVFTIHLL